MAEKRWSLDFSYAETSRRWQDGVVVYHPLSGDTFELNGLADDILCCLDGQPPQTTGSLIGHAATLYDEIEELPRIIDDTLRFLEEHQLVRAL
jgi:PqqD family protein of HPr-rel-A system